MARLITGPAADWLAARRSELNHRFGRMQRRYPALQAETVLDHLAELLPPLAGPEPASADLLFAVYDLVLLHAGRESFAARPGLVPLLREVFPTLRPALLERPSTLPGALSNAVENLGRQGVALVAALAGMGGQITSAAVLLDAVAVIAWRLGEARLRTAALAIAARLPPTLLLQALALGDFPAAAAPLVIDGLSQHGWCHPRARFSEPCLRGLEHASPAELAALSNRLHSVVVLPLSRWAVVARVGDFTGFDGSFERPPEVLEGGGAHLVLARCAEQDFRIDAHVFGWVCRAQPRQERAAAPGGMAAPPGLQVAGASLGADGTLTIGGDAAAVVGLAGADSVSFSPTRVATAHAHSHRIRIATAVPEPV